MYLGFISAEWPEDYPPFEKVLVILRSMEKAGLAELCEMSPADQSYYGQTHCWAWGDRVQGGGEYADSLGIRVGDWLYEYASRFCKE